MKITFFRIFCFFSLLICFLVAELHAELKFNVAIEGVADSQLQVRLRDACKLADFSDHKPISLIALRRRAETDVANLVQALHESGYYDGKVLFKLDNGCTPLLLQFDVEAGALYTFGNFRLVDVSESGDNALFEEFDPKSLGIEIGKPALPAQVLDAEEQLHRIAGLKGYPQFQIKGREALADQKHKTLFVTLQIDCGPLTSYGKTSITGNTTIDENFLRNKIAWREKEPFSLEEIVKTQAALEKTGLFSSTSVNYQISEEGQQAVMPMEIHVIEAKHRSIAAGLSYTTQRGPGLMAEWEHRNVRSRGERVNIRGSLWRDTHETTCLYLLPDFGKVDQNLIWQAALKHDIVKGYTETSLAFSGTIERKISDQLKISYGLAYKWVIDSNSDHDGNFHLLEAPLQLRWSTANSLLDPTKGYSLNLNCSPTVKLAAPYFAYCPTTLTGTCYHPLTAGHGLVFAAKASVGSIIGTSRHEIPPSERFRAGGENSFRGYRYETVCPLDKNRDPVGGRSLMLFSCEMRMRLSQQFGCVAFYELGNVYSSPFPRFNHKQLQAIGAGLRYHTPVGPIRLDVAVPLNRRKGIDSSFQIYMSIGQAF